MPKDDKHYHLGDDFDADHVYDFNVGNRRISTLDYVIKYLEYLQGECTERYKLNYQNMEEARGKQYSLYKYNKEQYYRFLGASATLAGAIKFLKKLKEKNNDQTERPIRSLHRE